MSLISTRGRFSKKQITRDDIQRLKNTSAISSSGKLPMFGISTNNDFLFEENNTKIIDKNERKSNSNLIFKSQTLFGKKVKKFTNTKQKKEQNTNNEKLEFENEFDFTQDKNSIKPLKIVAMFVVETLTIVAILFFGRFVRMLNISQKVEFKVEEVKNTNIDSVTLKKMEGYLTVALFGLDNRNGAVNSGNADVNKIIHLNYATGEIKIISIYRDLYLSITDGNSYGKLNAAYSRGGPQNSVKVLNKNLDLDIKNYFSFNWKSVANVIDVIGGVDVEVTKSEMKYFNAFIHETCVSTGIEAKNPAAHYVKTSGYQHLDGVQSVAYARLRLTDNDIKRTERQNTILKLCLEKIKKMDPQVLIAIAEGILPNIAYNFDLNDLKSLASTVRGINIGGSYGFPTTQNIKMMSMGSNGDCIVPNSLASAVKKLHAFMYEDSPDYKPSSAVNSYSNRILELMRQYEQENENKNLSLNDETDSDKQSDVSTDNNSSSNNQSTNKTNVNKRTNNSNLNTSDSNDSSHINNDELPKINENALPIDNDIYEAEPEEDINKVTVIDDLPFNNTNKVNSPINSPQSSGNVVAPISNPTNNVNILPPVSNSQNNGRTLSPSFSQSANVVPAIPSVNPPSSSGNLSNAVNPVVISGPPG